MQEDLLIMLFVYLNVYESILNKRGFLTRCNSERTITSNTILFGRLKKIIQEEEMFKINCGY